MKAQADELARLRRELRGALAARRALEEGFCTEADLPIVSWRADEAAKEASRPQPSDYDLAFFEPGQSIGVVGCPACGQLLEIEHGDDEGIAATTTGKHLPRPPAEPKIERAVNRAIAETAREDGDSETISKLARKLYQYLGIESS